MVRVGSSDDSPPIQPAQSTMPIKKTENGHTGTRVSDTAQQKISAETVASLSEINPSQISENQKHTLQDLQVIAEGATQALSLFSLIEDSNIESQSDFIDLLEQTHSKTEDLLGKNNTIRDILSLATHLINLSPSQQSKMETHNAISDMAQIVSFVLKQFLESSKVSDNTKEAAQQSLDKIQSMIPVEEKTNLSSLLGLPSIASNIYSVLKWMDYMKDIPGLTFAFGGTTSIAATIMAAIEMDENIAIEAKHRSYGKELTPLKVSLLKATITTAATSESPEEVKDVLLPSERTEKILESLITKRKETHMSRLEKEGVSLDHYLKELSEKGPRPLDSFPRLLKKRGIDLKKIPGGESIQTLKELNIKLKDPEFKTALLEQKIRYQDGMTTTAKNILKECLLDNQKINQKFFSWKLLQSAINFSASVFIGAATVIMASIVFAGLSIAFFPVMVPTLAAIGLGAGLAITGLAILAKNKPNLLKEILKGTKIRLAFHELPRSLNAWRLKVNQAELAENNMALLQFLEARPTTLQGLEAFRDAPKEDVPPALLNLYNHLQKKAGLSLKDLEKFEIKENELLEEQKKISEVVEKYKQRFNYFEGKIHTIQNQLKEARAKDFARNTKFHVKDFELVAEGLVEGEFWQDEEAVKFIKSYIGLDLEPFKNQYAGLEAKEKLKAVLDKKMRNAILQNSTQLIEWLKKRDISK